MQKIKDVIKLIRIKHWVKNLLVFAAMFFSMEITWDNCYKLIIGFFAFSFISSVVYIINDIFDKEKDAKHNIKKNRPIASGRISVRFAIILSIILSILSVLFNYLISGFNLKLYIILLGYLVLNLAYTFKLKNVVLIDVLCIVLGFIARLYYGSIIVSVEVSKYLYLTVMFASFFLGFGKRRNELINQSDIARPTLKNYNQNFLDKNMYVSLALTAVFYSLWAISQDGLLFLVSIPLISIVFFKYSLIIEGDSFGDPVDVIFSDKSLMVYIILYGITLMGALVL